MKTLQPISVQERVERARDLFTQGYNCAQSVFLAYSDLFELDPTLAATLSSSFGGGMGRLREVCGTVSGMALVASLLKPANDPTNREAKAENYALVQEFAEAFRRENGAIVCRELLGLNVEKQAPAPEARTPEYYRKRPCKELVACAAEIVGRYIENQTQK